MGAGKACQLATHGYPLCRLTHSRKLIAYPGQHDDDSAPCFSSRAKRVGELTRSLRSKFKMVWHRFSKVQFPSHHFGWKVRPVQFGARWPNAKSVQFSLVHSVHFKTFAQGCGARVTEPEPPERAHFDRSWSRRNILFRAGAV